MVGMATERFGRLDILVNNAGVSHWNQKLTEVSEADFDRVYAVNVKALYWAARHAVPVMAAQGGGVMINTASTAGLRPRPGLCWYNGSKGACILITKSMAVELAPQNIRVNALCPVAGETPLLAHFLGGDTPENRARFVGYGTARAAEHPRGCGECRAVARLGRGTVHHRRGTRGRRRTLHLGSRDRNEAQR